MLVNYFSIKFEKKNKEGYWPELPSVPPTLCGVGRIRGEGLPISSPAPPTPPHPCKEGASPARAPGNPGPVFGNGSCGGGVSVRRGAGFEGTVGGKGGSGYVTQCGCSWGFVRCDIEALPWPAARSGENHL